MNYLVLKQRFYLVISVLTLIVLGSSYGSCTKFSDKLSDSAMVALDSFHHCQYMALSRGIGYAGRRSEQLDYADQLSRHTTVEQLAEIANTDTSRIARLWAYRILLKKADNQVIDVLKQALKDTTYVEMESGCSGFEEPYNRAAISIYRYDSYELKLPNQLCFSLDSLVFFDYMKPCGFERGLLMDFKPHKIYSATVIEEADKGNDAILPLLAQYKNPNDRQRINKLLKLNLKKAGVCSMRHVKPSATGTTLPSSGMLRLLVKLPSNKNTMMLMRSSNFFAPTLPLGAIKYLKNCSLKKEITATVTLLRIILQSYIKRAPFPLFSSHYMIGMWQERSKA